VNSRPKLAPSSPSAASRHPARLSELTLFCPLNTPNSRAGSIRQLNTGGRTVGRTRTWVRRAHGLVGVISALNLLLLIITGFLLQHREMFRLDERMLSRKILPYIYRAEDGPEGVRADIVCRPALRCLFGRTGGWYSTGSPWVARAAD